jgi:hypothetical protein
VKRIDVAKTTHPRLLAGVKDMFGSQNSLEHIQGVLKLQGLLVPTRSWIISHHPDRRHIAPHSIEPPSAGLQAASCINNALCPFDIFPCSFPDVQDGHLPFLLVALHCANAPTHLPRL